jgi:CBS domain-containing protein
MMARAAPPSSASALLALDAAVIDTETTGLDPRKAHIVEMAAIPLVAGRIMQECALRRLVRPTVSIPAPARAVHGIDDAAVANAPTFAQAWPEFAGFIGEAVVIGHAVGFDLAVISRECDQAAVAWKPPRALDTRLLAQAVEPSLADHALESLAAWLEIEVQDRHSALGDALLCARIFIALLPRLRDAGIRTLGEAERACRTSMATLDAQHHAGWVEPAAPSAGAEHPLARIDTYPYRHRVRDVMRTPAQFVAPDLILRDALARMMQQRISSVYIRPPHDTGNPVAAGNAGIITERDLLRALATHGNAALDMPVERFMRRPLAAVPQDAFVYRAIGRMNALGIRHLGVTDEGGSVVGALSARDLLRLRAQAALTLGEDIEGADDASALARAWATLPHVAAALRNEGIPARDIAAVISRELGALTRRAAILAEQGMRNNGRGDPPCPYAVAVLGSAGRDESLLAMDQDNALFFAHGVPGGDEDQWFAALGGLMSDILHEAGVPYCRGGVMASKPGWRGSLVTWRERIDGWMRHSNPADLLSVDIFFDLRSVHGDAARDGIRRRP